MLVSCEIQLKASRPSPDMVKLTVPMYRALNWQLILDKHFELVPLINFDQWAWLLAINKVDVPSKTICRTISNLQSSVLRRTITWSGGACVDCKVIRAQSSIRWTSARKKCQYKERKSGRKHVEVCFSREDGWIESFTKQLDLFSRLFNGGSRFPPWRRYITYALSRHKSRTQPCNASPGMGFAV